MGIWHIKSVEKQDNRWLEDHSYQIVSGVHALKETLGNYATIIEPKMWTTMVLVLRQQSNCCWITFKTCIFYQVFFKNFNLIVFVVF